MRDLTSDPPHSSASASEVQAVDLPSVPQKPSGSMMGKGGLLSNSGEGRDFGKRADYLVRGLFVLIVVLMAIGFFVFPAYPTFDSYFTLLWGRDLIHLQAPVLDGWRYPSQHPLATVVGAILSLFGRSGDRLWTAMSLAAYLSLLWGTYRLARDCFTRGVGLVTAALLLLSFDYLFLAIRGYIDVPFMAFVIWAAVLENQRSRRGMSVFFLLLAAGLLRPEAWVIAGIYWLWFAWKASWRQRILTALVVGAAPVLWVAMDYLLTGDPLFTMHFTSGVSEYNERQRTLAEVPMTVPHFLVDIMGIELLGVAVLGLLIAVILVPRRASVPLGLFVAAVVTYMMIAAAGSSVIWRYMVLGALPLFIFAAVVFRGSAMLCPGSWVRRGWAILGGIAVAYGVFGVFDNFDGKFWEKELGFRTSSHNALVQILDNPTVRAGLRCGPISVPSHKLVPDVRWIVNLPDNQIIARGGSQKTPDRGVALFVTGRDAMMRQALEDRKYPVTIEIPKPPFRRVAQTEFYAAYISCPGGRS